jgi:hypothetical protein
MGLDTVTGAEMDCEFILAGRSPGALERLVRHVTPCLFAA